MTVPAPLEQCLQEGHVKHLEGNQMLHGNDQVFQKVHTIFLHQNMECLSSWTELHEHAVYAALFLAEKGQISLLWTETLIVPQGKNGRCNCL